MLRPLVAKTARAQSNAWCLSQITCISRTYSHTSYLPPMATPKLWSALTRLSATSRDSVAFVGLGRKESLGWSGDQPARL